GEPTMALLGSRKEDGGEPAARRNRERIRRSHRLEELEKLLARGLLVPGAVLADDLQELVDPGLALARGEERPGKLLARLEILGIALDAGLEVAEGALGLGAGLRELERRAGGHDLGMGRGLLGCLLERRLRALEVVAREIGARQTADRVGVVGLVLQH